MKKKALPVGTMFLMLVIALALLGVGYALWSETLTITGTVQTGEVDVEFSQHPVEECIDINGVLTCPEPPEKSRRSQLHGGMARSGCAIPMATMAPTCSGYCHRHVPQLSLQGRLRCDQHGQRARARLAA